MPTELGHIDSATLALFLDLDGTLIELAETPDAVEVAPELVRMLLHTVKALDSALAIITGRTIDAVDRLLAPLVLPVAGTHGAERRRADGYREGVSVEILAAARRIADELADFARNDARLLVEAKPASVALHFRRAPEREHECVHFMEAVLSGSPHFVLGSGKMVVEARIKGINKGEAIRTFLKEEPFVARMPVFVGDDVTDEDGFRVVQEFGGYGIKVGDGPTVAACRVADVSAAHQAVAKLARLSERP